MMQHLATALGGVLAGFALAVPLLWQQQRTLTKVRWAATHDDITGLPNRRLFLDRLRAALAGNTPVGVVLLDLNHFKTVNDTVGHEAGNDLLDLVGRRLTDLPGPVLAARLSGDEFALLVTGDRDTTAGAADAAWRVIATHPFRVVNGELHVTASVGYTHTHTHRPSIGTRQLLSQADSAMYEAKVTTGHVREYLPHRTATVRSRDRQRP
ncbi:GGDEF domain-containing protein [Micromonospora sp. HUAS LYJ1]|uniref:GGDEF domain-containing protein n=1 Tax=Micromonospora sp. HUAS LYJ1 TaxID=3061626 RepID=UPI002671AD64|nr:GGDEF domain-containing protein [Micromonospora sp. HUAS LYJ1]WKU03429.1 GGDEF domain-containing protein [Micromonospora sp. HUAS LYJ1]